jgi:hypothetical protein
MNTYSPGNQNGKYLSYMSATLKPETIMSRNTNEKEKHDCLISRGKPLKVYQL